MISAFRPASPEQTDPPAEALLRQVRRGASELRQGGVVAVGDARGWLAVLAAETAEPAGVGELLGMAAGAPLIVLSRRRWASVLGQDSAGDALEEGAAPAAMAAGPDLLDAAVLRSLADPTCAQREPELVRPLLRAVEAPALSGIAIALAKAARLLPAALVAPLAGVPPEGMVRVSEAAMVEYPHALSTGLRVVAEAAVPLESAPDARVLAFRPADGGMEHLAILVGRPEQEAAPLVRVHSACLTGDLLGSLRCDCGPQLRAGLARMHEEGAGVLLYLAQEGRGIGLVNKLRAYAVQDRGEDTVDANLSLGWAVDERSFLAASIMLRQLGIGRVRLLTNNPAKLASLAAHGIEVVGRVPHVMAANGVNDAYLEAKSRRLGHLSE